MPANPLSALTSVTQVTQERPRPPTHQHLRQSMAALVAAQQSVAEAIRSANSQLEAVSRLCPSHVLQQMQPTARRMREVLEQSLQTLQQAKMQLQRLAHVHENVTLAWSLSSCVLVLMCTLSLFLCRTRSARLAVYQRRMCISHISPLPSPLPSPSLPS